MNRPLDEWEAELYAVSGDPPSIELRWILVASLGFLALAGLILVVFGAFVPGRPPAEARLGLGSLLLFTGSALFLGWLLGATITLGGRLVGWIR